MGWVWQKTGEYRSPCCLAFSEAPGARTPALPSELLLGHGQRTIHGPCWILQSRKKGLSKYSRRAPTQGWQEKLWADAYAGTPGGSPGLQDKYCPFVSADWRDQQIDELKIIIIIILIIHISKGGNQICDICVCSP